MTPAEFVKELNSTTIDGYVILHENGIMTSIDENLWMTETDGLYSGHTFDQTFRNQRPSDAMIMIFDSFGKMQQAVYIASKLRSMIQVEIQKMSDGGVYVDEDLIYSMLSGGLTDGEQKLAKDLERTMSEIKESIENAQ